MRWLLAHVNPRTILERFLYFYVYYYLPVFFILFLYSYHFQAGPFYRLIRRWDPRWQREVARREQMGQLGDADERTGSTGDAEPTPAYPGVASSLFRSVLRLTDISNAYPSTRPWEPPRRPWWRSDSRRERYQPDIPSPDQLIPPPNRILSGPGNPYPTPPPEPDQPRPENAGAEVTMPYDTRLVRGRSRGKSKIPLRNVFKAGSLRGAASTSLEPPPYSERREQIENPRVVRRESVAIWEERDDFEPQRLYAEERITLQEALDESRDPEAGPPPEVLRVSDWERERGGMGCLPAVEGAFGRGRVGEGGEVTYVGPKDPWWELRMPQKGHGEYGVRERDGEGGGAAVENDDA